MRIARIGVTRWEEVPGESIERYWQRLRDAGVEPVDLHERDVTVHMLDGLVLTGGVDIDPARYGEEPHEKVRRTDPDRDVFEFGLLQAALAQDLPVLGICRGNQVMNVAFGGSLLQHIDSGQHTADYRTEGYPSRDHMVDVVPGTMLHEVLRAASLHVNSRHHQAVTPDRLAPGLRAAALSPDGLVEALESTRHAWVVSVQWHPERDEPQIPGFAASGHRLFAALAEASRARLAAHSA
jgi:putative glutamine amidotransferase